MSDKNAYLIRDLLAMIAGNQEHGCGCNGSDCCCSCTTGPSMEAQAVRANERAGFTAAESMQNFVDRQAAYHSHMMTQLNDFRVKPT